MSSFELRFKNEIERIEKYLLLFWNKILDSLSIQPDVDHDCNGIFGIDPKTGKPWEDELCAGTQPMGVAILGNSAGNTNTIYL
jgi:hypothetical protein